MSPWVWLAATGALYLAATIALAVTQAPLGSPVFFLCAGTAGVAYLVLLSRLRNDRTTPRRYVVAMLLLALAIRAPLAVPRVNADNDMVRYLWDGRVQTLGYSPYAVLPSDPEMAGTHTDETRQMPSLRSPTPYPPAAQLFFRVVVSIHDSTRAMKLALEACDLLTILVLWRWLAITGRPEWLVVTYAWNPLVILEIAHSGHLDALGALWILASAYCVTRGRTALASIAYVLAIATKLLPIVLLPLFWKRVRLRDGFLGAVVLTMLYLAYTRDGVLPFGAVPNVVAHIRFNGPTFKFFSAVGTPRLAALAAVGLGMIVAAWSRWRLHQDDPAAWAWPMAIALAAAPVIYPWYLLYFTPFLFSSATLPLVVWTITIIPTYLVWELAQHGARWVVPLSVMAWEYGLVLLIAAIVCWHRTVRTQPNPGQPSSTV
jgi:hypothetical protein